MRLSSALAFHVIAGHEPCKHNAWTILGEMEALAGQLYYAWCPFWILLGSVLCDQMVDRLHDLFDGQAGEKGLPNLDCAAEDGCQWEHRKEMHAALEKSQVGFAVQSCQDTL